VLRPTPNPTNAYQYKLRTAMNYLQSLEPQRGNVKVFAYVTISDMCNTLKRGKYPKHKRALFST
jgi:hypothetical protein